MPFDIIYTTSLLSLSLILSNKYLNFSSRSGKHDGSSAESHHKDAMSLANEPQFGGLKTCPIVIISVDGGPDENPRFPKTLYHKIEMLKELNLDICIVLTHAPGKNF